MLGVLLLAITVFPRGKESNTKSLGIMDKKVHVVVDFPIFITLFIDPVPTKSFRCMVCDCDVGVYVSPGDFLDSQNDKLMVFKEKV
jgi:hypothetical protein